MKSPKKPAQRPSPKSRHKPSNQVRIIGGLHKRRLLNFIDADGLRPTPDRLRETIFNWLTGQLYHAKVLDTCAGSGALGFEAISRGAMMATLIEPNTAQAHLLADNAKSLRIDEQMTVINHDALHALPTLTGVFDIVFIDPPYALNLWRPILTTLLDNRLITADSLIYLEADKPLATVLGDDLLAAFEIVKDTKVGQAGAYLLKLAQSS
ncbi:16S rRNA (guanine(966)-N(2))-methyltransferase RsmD [Moraxella sp. ZJ142]|uniref:16S rRNA (guanine(966)-N(2))-methyltransferase RsmD n=1 Tax=Moraxella marmotae TaxID=3344520 RepID=UPI0035D3FED3